VKFIINIIPGKGLFCMFAVKLSWK